MPGILDHIYGSIKTVIIWGLTIIVDSLFLYAWVWSQAKMNEFISSQNLTGLDSIFYWIFQGLFGISTLVAVLLFTYRDLKILYLKTLAEIRQTQDEISK